VTADRSGPPPTRNGFDIRICASALQKACRRGQVEDAAFWAAELDRSGFTAYAFRRLAIIASEDCSATAEPALVVHAMHAAWKTEREREKSAKGVLFLMNAVLVVASAPKGRIADSLVILNYWGDPKPPEIGDHVYDGHTPEGRAQGRGWTYFYEESGLLIDFETGELTQDGAVVDPYRERAREVLESGRKPRQARPIRPAEPEQMTLEGDQ
jgi:replication-associated recombination protein RarA